MSDVSDAAGAVPATTHAVKTAIEAAVGSLRTELLAVLETKATKQDLERFATKQDLERMRVEIGNDVQQRIDAAFESFDARFAVFYDLNKDVLDKRKGDLRAAAALRADLDHHRSDATVHVRPRQPRPTRRARR